MESVQLIIAFVDRLISTVGEWLLEIGSMIVLVVIVGGLGLLGLILVVQLVKWAWFII